jgi:hypothetical protein
MKSVAKKRVFYLTEILETEERVAFLEKQHIRDAEKYAELEKKYKVLESDSRVMELYLKSARLDKWKRQELEEIIILLEKELEEDERSFSDQLVRETFERYLKEGRSVVEALTEAETKYASKRFEVPEIDYSLESIEKIINARISRLDSEERERRHLARNEERRRLSKDEKRQVLLTDKDLKRIKSLLENFFDEETEED